ncbi:MAG TPA: LacI family DNA-binding transcriptional regulator [Arachnia sp.]|nr:LacI family DNA-binding transcriptional regulator [Arachnia sp.]
MTQQAPPGRAPKMADVGRLAGVSAQTVSRYFTGSGYVGTETRARIEDAIEQLGYTLNQSARNLRANSTRSIGVLLSGPSLYGAWTVMSGLNLAAQSSEYGLVTSPVEFVSDDPHVPQATHWALERLLMARVDGIIISSSYLGIEDLLERVWEKVPVVMLSGRAWPNADSATVDSFEAGRLATEHLLELGHRRILHLAGPQNTSEGYERERGYRDALTRAGVEALPVVSGDWSAESGEARGLEVDPHSFSAVFSGNDQMALGFLAALRRRGRTAPQDFSVVGVDDMPDARYFTPPLTSMYMDFAALGRAGFEMIIERIRTGERVPRRVIRPRLVVRESTAPFA